MRSSEQKNEVLRHAAAWLGGTAENGWRTKRTSFVRDLAVDEILVAVSCRASGVAHKPFYGWRESPFTDVQLNEADLTNALFDSHRGAPEFGYWFLTDEIRLELPDVLDRTVWRICRDRRSWSVFSKPTCSKGARPATSFYDDLVTRNFSTTRSNQVWLSNVTKYRARNEMLCGCVIQAEFSN